LLWLSGASPLPAKATAGACWARTSASTAGYAVTQLRVGTCRDAGHCYHGSGLVPRGAAPAGADSTGSPIHRRSCGGVPQLSTFWSWCHIDLWSSCSPSPWSSCNSSPLGCFSISIGHIDPLKLVSPGTSQPALSLSCRVGAASAALVGPGAGSGVSATVWERVPWSPRRSWTWLALRGAQGVRSLMPRVRPRAGAQHRPLGWRRSVQDVARYQDSVAAAAAPHSASMRVALDVCGQSGVSPRCGYRLRMRHVLRGLEQLVGPETPISRHVAV
jgi:hypothetical protein